MKNPSERKPSVTEKVSVTEDTESRRDGGTEKQKRNGVIHGSHVTEEKPPLAARVATLPDAARIALEECIHKDCLFVFARALKAFEITTRCRLSASDLPSAFSLWCNLAKPQLPADADFDEWWMLFEHTFAQTKHPLGANPLTEAIRRADSQPMPPAADRYSSPKLRRLVAVCFHLQAIAGHNPFFLSVRDAAKIIDQPNLNTASAYLKGLERDGILRTILAGVPGGRQATRFKLIGEA